MSYRVKIHDSTLDPLACCCSAPLSRGADSLARRSHSSLKVRSTSSWAIDGRDDLVDEPVLASLLRRHIVVTVEILDDTLARLAGHLGVHADERALDLQDLLRLHPDVLGLTARAA